MSTALSVWAIGGLLGLLFTLCAAVADGMNDERPRVVLGGLARRAVVAVAWPVAVPAYLVAAYRRDEW